MNDTPVATGESYSTNAGVPLVVATPGVLGNDTDRDSPYAHRAARGRADSRHAGPQRQRLVHLHAGRGLLRIGCVYLPGKRRRSDRGSNVVTVSLTVNTIVYGFVNVQNLPPPANKTFKRGSTVGLKWQFTLGGVAVDSTNANVSITITDASGASVTFRPQEPGHNEFKLPTAANGWTWQFNWQTVSPAAPGRHGAAGGQLHGQGDQRTVSGQTFPAPPASHHAGEIAASLSSAARGAPTSLSAPGPHPGVGLRALTRGATASLRSAGGGQPYLTCLRASCASGSSLEFPRIAR